MVIIELQVKPYLAEYARAKYNSVDGGVLFPAESLLVHAIVNATITRPRTVVPVSGNLQVAIREKGISKDMHRNNYLKASSMKHISDLLYIDFKSTLCEYMDSEYYKHGIDYQVSAAKFYEKYRLQSITVEALLKIHIRWKHQRKLFRKEAEQREISFNKLN